MYILQTSDTTVKFLKLVLNKCCVKTTAHECAGPRALSGTCSAAAHIKAFCSGCWAEYVPALQTNAPFIFQINVSHPSRCESRLFLGIGVCVHKHIERDKRTPPTPTQAPSRLGFGVAELFILPKLGAVVLSARREKMASETRASRRKEATRRGRRAFCTTRWRKESIDSLSSSS